MAFHWLQSPVRRYWPHLFPSEYKALDLYWRAENQLIPDHGSYVGKAYIYDVPKLNKVPPRRWWGWWCFSCQPRRQGAKWASELPPLPRSLCPPLFWGGGRAGPAQPHRRAVVQGQPGGPASGGAATRRQASRRRRWRPPWRRHWGRRGRRSWGRARGRFPGGLPHRAVRGLRHHEGALLRGVDCPPGRRPPWAGRPRPLLPRRQPLGEGAGGSGPVQGRVGCPPPHTHTNILIPVERPRAPESLRRHQSKRKAARMLVPHFWGRF